MPKDKDIKIVYSRKVKNELINRGFRPIRTESNKKMPGFDVWIFERVPAFNIAFDEILSEGRGQK